MGTKSVKTPTPKKSLEEVAKKFAEQLVKTANDTDPQHEADFQAREAAREAAVTKALKEHLAKRKK